MSAVRSSSDGSRRYVRLVVVAPAGMSTLLIVLAATEGMSAIFMIIFVTVGLDSQVVVEIVGG